MPLNMAVSIDLCFLVSQYKVHATILPLYAKFFSKCIPRGSLPRSEYLTIQFLHRPTHLLSYHIPEVLSQTGHCIEVDVSYCVTHQLL